ncbi:hypothetical protein DQ04_03491000, partial [Trypanosoma grayi]|uniref:hypothetical protein n=1 Tax=Trypanosoma grayi TaxID=71804 RepID=UPI0004F46647
MEELLEREIEDLKHQQALLEQELVVIDDMSSGAWPSSSSSSTLVDVASLQSLDEMRRRHQREANRALQRYFEVVSDYPKYQANRERQLSGARPFSFEARELQRGQRIRTRRIEEERRQRE